MTVTPNQSYLTKELQYRLAAALAGFLLDVRANVGFVTPTWDHPGSSLVPPNNWRKDNMVFTFGPGDQYSARVKFSATRWDPEHSDLDYGDKKIMQNVQVNDDAKTKIVRNETDGELHVAYEEEASLTNSFSSSITNGVTLDVTKSKTDTKDASVDAEQTISGEYAGVSAEAKLAEHFGISQEKAESRSEGHSSELAKEKAEEGTTSEKIAIDFSAKPRSNYLVTITKENERTEQPFDINGIEDFDVEITFGKDGGGKLVEHCPYGTVMLKGVDALEQFMHGYDTDYPKMAGYWDKAGDMARYGIAFVLDPKNRRIQATGTSYAELQSNADYKVELLGNKIPADLDNLPVVDASDL